MENRSIQVLEKIIPGLGFDIKKSILSILSIEDIKNIQLVCSANIAKISTVYHIDSNYRLLSKNDPILYRKEDINVFTNFIENSFEVKSMPNKKPQYSFKVSFFIIE